MTTHSRIHDRTNRFRLFGATIAIALGVLSGGLLTAAPASASVTASVMATTQRMAAPSLSAHQSGWYNSPSRVALTCFTRGQSVKGFYSRFIVGGYDNLWYQVNDGYFIADVDINTGSNNPVTAECTPGPTPVPPKPAPTIAAAVDAFVARYTNQYVDFDGQYGAQCVDLFNFYNRDVVGAPFVKADVAYQLYTSAPSNKYTRLSASVAPQKGDVAIYGSGLPASGGAGHVGIVLSQVNASTLSLFEQHVRLTKTGPYSASIVRNESKSYLLGYLRPIR